MNQAQKIEMETRAEKDSEWKKQLVLLQAIAFFFLLYFGPFRASANPLFNGNSSSES
jgi:hypothetical protein